MNWDLTSYFPRFDHPSRQRYQDELSGTLSALTARAKALPELTEASQNDWTEIVLALEECGARTAHYRSYVGCLAAADSSDVEVRSVEAEVGRLGAQLEILKGELRRACAETDAQVFDAWLQRTELDGAGYFIRHLRQQAATRMPPPQEELAAMLGIDGIAAWGRLYSQVTGALTFELPGKEGESRTLPIAARRSLLEDSDRAVRQAAFAKGNEAFETVAETLAAALNHIAGTRLTLAKQRGLTDALEPALFDGAVSRASIEAMYEAVQRQIALPRRVLKLKARAERREQLAWYDLGAPIAVSPVAAVSWSTAKNQVRDAFARTYPALAEFFEHAITNNWVDWEQRLGKRSGAFCSSSPVLDESRIFMNFGGTLSDVSTLAHEVGHAYHSHVMAGMRSSARRYPMTLAETASTFAELMLSHGAMETAEPPVRAAYGAHILNDAPIFLLDITVRFQFERAFYEQRKQGELSVAALGKLMRETQHNVLGDVLEEDGADPLYWASKLHFYLTGVSFYNFPYTFGYLLSRALHAEFLREGAAFLPRYERFLRLSGSTDAVSLARDVLGVDLEQPEFWEGSIVGLEQALEVLEGSTASPVAAVARAKPRT